MSKQQSSFRVDPRSGLLILLFANISMFAQDSLRMQTIWILFLTTLYLVSGQGKSGMKWCLAYVGICLLQWKVFPIAPKMVVTSFSIFTNYARRMMPCMMIGWYLIRTIRLRELVAALRALHLPQSMLIPIIVTLRYFPAIREEAGHIRDALKLRQITGMEKMEAFVVPFMMSAIHTAEELSEAAVTRGIENPVPKQTTVVLRIQAFDYICVTIVFAYMMCSLIL